MDPTDQGESSLVGRLLCGRWRLERRLGAGGMSAVYAAVHRNGKRVAIKVLGSGLTSVPKVRERFMREGHIANRVGHEGAVEVYDDGVDGELVFLVMELLDGETLAGRARRLGGTLSAAEVAFAAEGLLDVLAAAHAAGIVHRDVNPENVFLTRRGQIKLLDFGIASVREMALGLSDTQTGRPLGTPGFMAPEQVRGRWGEVDGRSDLWSVGATMFRALTGQPVHPGHTPSEVMLNASTRPAPSLADRCPGLPRPLVAVVDRALSFEPRFRWKSAAQMQQALRVVKAELPAWSWRPPPADPRDRQSPTHHEGADDERAATAGRGR